VRLWPKGNDGPILDPQAAKNHIAYHAMPMPGILGLMRAADSFWEHAHRIPNPTLILHSTQDATSDFYASCELLARLGAPDKRLVAFSKSNHILTVDREKQRVEAETLDFLHSRR
jgi:carboxylesterase